MNVIKLQIMAGAIFWISRICVTFVYFVVNCLQAIYFWGKRKTIPPIRNPLLFKSATQLAREIRNGKLKSEDVVQAFIDRIREVQPIINAVAEDCFQDALDEAREADALVESGLFTEQQLEENKPLFGVPFSVKVLLSIKGHKNTAACLLFKDRMSDEDADVVAAMKESGAILLTITNAAELGSCMETDNPLYGKTCNPYDTTRTPGGSSGGESALISSGGSLIGLGNDLMGSIRIPAHFCGLFAHKPTLGRVSTSGSNPICHPSNAFMAYIGPICRYAEDLITSMNILSSKNEDKIRPELVNFRHLKIYYKTDVDYGWAMSTDDDISRAIHNAATHFTKKYGATMTEVKIPLLNRFFVTSMQLLASGVPDVASHITFGKYKNFKGIREFYKYLIGKSIFTLFTIYILYIARFTYIFNKENYVHHQKLKQKLEEELEELLDENSVLLYPTLPRTAPYHKGSFFMIPSSTYTCPFNCTGFPVTQCPMGISKSGMPFGIQIVGGKSNDALTMACAVELEKEFGGWVPPEMVEKKRKQS